MTIYEKLKTMTFEQMCSFWYSNGKRRGIKKTHEFLGAEYNEKNCNTVDAVDQFENICDNYCKWPGEYKDPDDLLNEKSGNCPIIELF